jgi:DNA repair protein RadD
MPEPDMTGVKMTKEGEFVQSEMRSAVSRCTVFADVFDTYIRLAQNRPTIVWAPGVPESRWVVDEFRKRGITAEHIDGATDEADRHRIRDGSRIGSIRVVSSCGVLKEGIDWPWVSYGILLQVCGAYGTFIQIVGRILRAWPGKQDAILQDHSGTWWRHGSPNFDREWALEDTNERIREEKQNRKIKNSDTGETVDDGDPIRCGQCGGIRMSGERCPHCGFCSRKSSRPIRKADGTLVDMDEQKVPRPHKPQQSDIAKAWTAALFRCGCTGKTFQQAAGLVMKETGKWPCNFPDCQPRPEPNSPDWNRKIADIYPAYDRRKR